MGAGEILGKIPVPPNGRRWSLQWLLRRAPPQLPAMLDVRKGRTAAGRLMLVIGDRCSEAQFARHAAAVAAFFGMKPSDVVQGMDTLLMIVRRDDDPFCLSWDIWMTELTVMAWQSTPDEAIEALISKLRIARSQGFHE